MSWTKLDMFMKIGWSNYYFYQKKSQVTTQVGQTAIQIEPSNFAPVQYTPVIDAVQGHGLATFTDLLIELVCPLKILCNNIPSVLLKSAVI